MGFEGKGVLVGDVQADLPGAKAGLKRGDIITSLDGQSVSSAEELRRIIAARGPNATVRLSVHRDGKSLDISMKLAEMPAELMAAGSREGGPDSGGTPGRFEPLRKLGIDQVTTMTRALAEQFNLEFNAGVLVPSVRSGSTADAAGLRPGQVITGSANTPVMNVESRLGEMAKYDLKVGVRLIVTVDKVNRYVLIKLPS